MSFRRIPFQFSTTDPVERQRELEKRFGLPTNQNMYIDVNNPLSSGTIPKETSSPRLQHRIPIFADGYDQPMNSSVDSRCSNPDNKKPNVRVIPIEIEGADSKPSTRHRTFSGPAGMVRNQRETPIPVIRNDSTIKNSMEDLSKPTKVTSSEPRVFNIPIQIEGANSTPKSPKPKREKKEVPKANGCHVSKSADNIKSPMKEKTQKKKEPAVSPEQEVLKKIEKVLEEFASYEKGVQEFQGTVKEKQYRYLDEMLTRCMLRLDELDTMGNEELRVARKNAVRKIQASIDLLESKANSTNEVKMENSTTSKADAGGQDVEMKEQKDVVQENDTEAEKDQSTDTAEVKDVEMKENSVASDAAQDGTSDTQTTDSPAANLENESQCAVNDVDMSEGKESVDNPGESVCSDSKVSENVDENQTDEVLVNSENSSAALTEEVQLNKCSSGTEEANKLPEVEMSEVATDGLVKEPVKEMNEIEMVDSNLTDVSNPTTDGIIETSDSVPSQDSSNAVIDVEMNDLPSDGMKDVPEKTEENSSSVQLPVEHKDNQTITDEKSVIVDAKDCISDTENEPKTADSCSNSGDTNKS